MESASVDRYRLTELEHDIEPLRPLPGRVDAVEQRQDAVDKRLDITDGKIDRLTLAILTLALSIAGSAVALMLTLGTP